MANIVLKKVRKQHRTLEERAKEYDGKLGPYEEFDWGRTRWTGKVVKYDSGTGGISLLLKKMKGFFLIVSKNFFNATEQAVLCPIVEHTFPDPLHIKIKTDEVSGVVYVRANAIS